MTVDVGGVVTRAGEEGMLTQAKVWRHSLEMAGEQGIEMRSLVSCWEQRRGAALKGFSSGGH